MHSNDPLHDKTPEMVFTQLVYDCGREDLGTILKINCFISNQALILH